MTELRDFPDLPLVFAYSRFRPKPGFDYVLLSAAQHHESGARNSFHSQLGYSEKSFAEVTYSCLFSGLWCNPRIVYTDCKKTSC